MKQHKLAESDELSEDDLVGSPASPPEERLLTSVVAAKAPLFEGLSPVRCFNYYTQLLVAGELITQSLDIDKTAVLILDKNAEKALRTLESLGFTLRQALLERKLDIYYYRKGVRNRNFFRKDYQAIFDAVLKQRRTEVQHLIMIEFNTLFANSIKDAVSNQIEDFCAVARTFNVTISGLYSPHSWYQDDFLSTEMPVYLGEDSVQEARYNLETKLIDYTVRSTSTTAS